MTEPVVEDSVDEKVKRWNQLKAHLAQQAKVFADYCAPFRAEQEQIEAWLHDFLNRHKIRSVKSDHGTPYISTITKPKIEDRTKYLDWCLEHWETGGDELLQLSAPQVTAFKAYVEEHKEVPPGTSVTYFEQINIRPT